MDKETVKQVINKNAPLKGLVRNLDCLIAAVIGFYIIHMFARYSGIGISPDSIMYASTATNIQAHGSLLTFNKHPLTFFPVFYPFCLGVIQFISGVDPIKAGAMIDAFLFGDVIFTTGWIMSGFLSDSPGWTLDEIKQSKFIGGWKVLIPLALILIIDYLIAIKLTYKVVVPDNLAWLSASLFKPPIGSTYSGF